MFHLNLLIFVILLIPYIDTTPIGQGAVPTQLGCNVCGQPQQNPTGQWSNWGEWGLCQSYSGSYGQVRTRQCMGSGCVGGNEEARHCTPNNGGGCNVCGGSTGSWSSWSEWGLCEETNQGYVKKRTRQCLSGSCQGNNEEIENCIQYDEPQQPTWQNWSSWTQCSVSCGGGVQTRTRQCNTQCGVCQCSGSSQEIRQCNTQTCCNFNEWQEWTNCSNQCGTGQRNRIRLCTCGNCPGESYQQQTCSSYTNCPSQNDPPTCNKCQTSVTKPPVTCPTCGPLVNQTPSPCTTCNTAPKQPITCTTCGTSSNNNGGVVSVGGLIG
uniref:Uncharacterized protein n=1 Tax=Strongyloides papillosus TaxID=174720 RepID=A0A0N5BLK6_STREA